MLIAFAQPMAQSGDSLRIEDVVAEVIKNNDRLAAARYMEQSAGLKIGPAGAWDDPMLMAGVSGLPTSFDFKMDNMTMKMIGLSQNIPYAGYKKLQSQAARSDARVSAEERRQVELELVATAKTAFYELYFRGLILNELKRQHEILEEVIKSIAGRLKSNQATQADLLASQAELWRLESEILSAEQALDEARYNINALRGAEIDSPLPIPAEPFIPSIPENFDVWLNAALANYPELQKTQHQFESYTFAARASSRMQWPMLGLSANYGFREAGPMGPRDDMIGFQATLSLPFFSGRAQGKMANSMDAMSQSMVAEARQIRRDVEARLRSLYKRSVRLTESLRLYRERIISTSNEAYRTALADYTAGRIPLTTLLGYATMIYSDNITGHQIANELAKTLAEVDKYIAAPESFGGDSLLKTK